MRTQRIERAAILAIATCSMGGGCRKVAATPEPAEATSDASATPPPGDATPPASPRFSLDAGALSVDLDGTTSTIAEGVEGFWPIAFEERDAGRATNAVAYARGDGAGGYENEGQSVSLWAPGYAAGRKLAAEYFQVRAVESLAARSGRSVLMVVMKDGGLGASHVAFVDPDRGEVFRADGADVVRREPGAVRIGWFRDDDWERLTEAAVRPKREERLDLDAVLDRPVMHNPRRP